MAKKVFFALLDTETTQDNLVADIGIVIYDRKGNAVNKMAVLVAGIYNNPQHPLFFDSSAPPNTIWSRIGQDKRYAQYNRMLDNGSRMMATISAINRWIAQAIITYNPILTAYNLAFDIDKCVKTGIDLSNFRESFCLWRAAQEKWAHTKAYREFVLQKHAFCNPTDLGNMSYRTNAETMARFVTGMPDLPDEPHTALEDVEYYEAPILKKLVATTSPKQYLNPKGGTWRDYQVKDWFTAK